MTNEIFKEEIMSEEELNGVSGGTIAELVADTQFLHDIGILERSYDVKQIAEHFGLVNEIVNRALYNYHFAIEAERDESTAANWGYRFEYSKYGSKATRRDVFYQKVCAAAGKPDFNYQQYL